MEVVVCSRCVAHHQHKLLLWRKYLACTTYSVPVIAWYKYKENTSLYRRSYLCLSSHTVILNWTWWTLRIPEILWLLPTLQLVRVVCESSQTHHLWVLEWTVWVVILQQCWGNKNKRQEWIGSKVSPPPHTRATALRGKKKYFFFFFSGTTMRLTQRSLPITHPAHSVSVHI